MASPTSAGNGMGGFTALTANGYLARASQSISSRVQPNNFAGPQAQPGEQQ